MSMPVSLSGDITKEKKMLCKREIDGKTTDYPI